MATSYFGSKTNETGDFTDYRFSLLRHSQLPARFLAWYLVLLWGVFGTDDSNRSTEEDRIENIRRAAETSKLFADCGVITICSLISPTHSIQKMASEIIGDKYVEVFINCPLEVCESRDVKGLYAKARRGEIKDFTGIDSPFEPPANADVVLKTDINSIEECHNQLVEFILNKVEYKK